MSIFSTGGGLFGGVSGGFVGNAFGWPGMILGAGAGSKIGSGIGRVAGNVAGFGGGGSDGDPYGGMSGYPTYIGMDPNGMELAPQFNGPNQQLNKFADESLRNGPSRGTEFALQQNRLGANAGRDQARLMAGGLAKDASANLAMHGGLGAGAAERIGKYSTNVGMEGANQADANASNSRAGLLIADENARTGNLAEAAGLVGQDRMQRYNMASGDLQRRQGEYDRRNAFNMNQYNQNMSAWAAGKQADATARSGKKS